MPSDQTFRALHIPGKPLILFNIWDAGSARAVAAGGAAALATGSASLAGAQGFPDGQALPLDLLLDIVTRIRAATDLPLSVDFEAGFADDPAGVGANAARLAGLGVAGINLEDGIPPEKGMRSADQQAQRIAAVRAAASDLFINARTDLFLQNPASDHAGLVADALDRARIYADAGADGFFVPGMVDPGLIAAFCRDCPLPVNIMKSPAAPGPAELAALGVARVSYGPFPWRDAMAELTRAAAAQMGGQGGQGA